MRRRGNNKLVHLKSPRLNTALLCFIIDEELLELYIDDMFLARKNGGGNGNENRHRNPPLRLRQLVCFGRKGLIRLRERLREKDFSSSQEGGPGGTVDKCGYVDNSKGEQKNGHMSPEG